MAMETARSRSGAAATGYGTSVHKQVYVYGGLDVGPIVINRRFGFSWSVAGWLLTPFLGTLSMEDHARLRGRVVAGLKTHVRQQLLRRDLPSGTARPGNRPGLCAAGNGQQVPGAPAVVTNRLAQSTSPYLLQHRDNPVDWWEWGPEAFAEAERRDVPVLLSIGYAACHWCHVMAHESFENDEIAAYMNEHFVNVKVDREERPDVDAVYMEAVQAMTGHGGWPMTSFLTAKGEPFFCGTYWPSEPRHGMPSFPQVLPSVAETWRTRRDDVEQAGREVVRAAVRVGERGLARGDGGAARQGSGVLEPVVRRGARRLGLRSEVPAVDGAGVPAAAVGADGRGPGEGRAHLRGDGARRHVRPARPAASRATPSTRSGWCRTSRRCSTTTRCCCGSTCTGGAPPARRSRAGSWRRPPTSCCATCAPSRAASRRRSTRTPTASRG